VTDDGSLYVCGNNDNGQLGLGENPTIVPNKLNKVIDCELADVGVVDVKIHDKFGAAIDKNGDVHTWGTGYSTTMMSGGWLGHGAKVNGVNRPTKIESLVEDGCQAKQIR